MALTQATTIATNGLPDLDDDSSEGDFYFVFGVYLWRKRMID